MDRFDSNSPPRTLQELDYDPLDSGSSSGDHSSPASDSASSNLNSSIWPSFSIVQLSGKATDDRWSTAPTVDTLPHSQESLHAQTEESSISLTSDFWSTAPSTTVHTPADTKSYCHAEGAEMDMSQNGLLLQELNAPSAYSHDAQSHSNFGPSSFPLSAAPQALYYPHQSLSMPVDLAAVNAGISPSLAGGFPSPPLQPPHESIESDKFDIVSSSSRSRSREPSRSNSVKEEEALYEQEMEEGEELSRPNRRVSAPGTNLVTKDPVVTSSIITRLTSPAVSTFTSTSNLQMLVLGVPTVGAKSRVETQIKLSFVLVRPLDAQEIDGDDHITPEGGIELDAGSVFERIGSYSHIRVPKFLALKKKKAAKKPSKPDPPVENTLSMEVCVLRGSTPKDEIFICPGCRQRELKRAQRKKEARVRPVDTDGAETDNEQEEMRKVVVFNCSEFVEFGEGEIILPTRITCYCRHHKEPKGFCISFVFKNYAGVVVATGSTPPIMITDDHKTNNNSRPFISTTAEVLATEASAPKGKRGRTSIPKPAAAAVASRDATDRPKRAAPSRSKPSRGIADSDEEESLPSGSSTRAANAMKKYTSTAKPYDSESRPRKRSVGVHKSPAFTMTPLPPSKANSPVLRPVADSALGPLPALPTHFESDAPLGYWNMSTGEWDGGFAPAGDALMRDNSSMTESSAPSPAQSFGLSAAASPPFSPPTHGINIPHIVDSFTPYNQTIRPEQTQYPPVINNYSQHYEPIQSIFANVVSPPPASSWSSFMHIRAPAPPAPRISRLIPGEGPIHGGTEVTVLGENFVRDLICVFGDSPAMTTHFWSSNTLICILPPSANPGPVVVGIQGLPLTVEEGNGLQLFTYKDDSDRSLLELALQVVGLKMTGRLEDAKNVAMRIVGSSNNGVGPSTNRLATPTDNAGLALSMAAATAAVYHTPAHSRSASLVSSRRSSVDYSTTLPSFGRQSGSTPLNFEAIVIRFLSLLDLDPSEIPGSAPSLPATESPISHFNAQRHTLLHLATVLGFHRLAQFLIARNIDLETPDRNGFTALHFATLYGRVAITRQLLDAGAASYARNRAGKTAHEIAIDRDDVDVEELFLKSRPAPINVPQRSYFTVGSVSRPSSTPGTPVSLYARSELRDDESDTCSNVSQQDDSTWDSSDEDESDIERGLSRNNSYISLRHLADSHSEGFKAAEASNEEEEEEEPVTTRVRSSMGWLPSIIFPPRPHGQVEATKVVWEKVPAHAIAGGAWEKLGLPTLPDVMVFPFSSKTLKSADQDATAPAESGEKSPKSGTWFGSKARRASASSPPPPMYSPTDLSPHVQPIIPIPTTSSTLRTTSGSNGPPLKAQVKAKIQRRVGYAPEDISDSVLQSYLHHEKKMRNLRSDKMLYLFWIPALLFALSWALYSSVTLLRPALDHLTYTLLPFSRTSTLLRS